MRFTKKPSIRVPKIWTGYLSKEQMEKLNTKRLLAYKKKYMSPTLPNLDNPDWQEAYKNIKEVLATREHVEK